MASPAARPCAYPLCVCLAPAGHEYCPPHRPQDVAARCKKIVADVAFKIAAAQAFQKDQELVMKVQREILASMEKTT